MFKLIHRVPSSIPLDVEGILPEQLKNLAARDVALLPVLHGNRREELGNFFDVQPSQLADLHFAGDTRNVHNIGKQMREGRIFIENSAGRHTGAQMIGGSIVIDDSASDWLGAEMCGGNIEVRGSAGNCAGAAYRGSRHGMKGGSIFIRGTAGDELGSLMRRGIIAVEGRVGAFAGTSMIAGTLALLGGAGGRLGAGMKRGTILVRGDAEPAAGFRYSCDYEPQVLPLLLREIRQFDGSLLPDAPLTVCCHRGDILTGGKGELWLL